MTTEDKYANIVHLIGCYSIYRTWLSLAHLWHLWPLVRFNEFKWSQHIPWDVRYIGCTEFTDYIPTVALKPWIPSVSCSYLVFPEVNVWVEEKNALTISLMHMHFLTFHIALSVLWIGPRLPVLQRHCHKSNLFLSFPHTFSQHTIFLSSNLSLWSRLMISMGKWLC